MKWKKYIAAICVLSVVVFFIGYLIFTLGEVNGVLQ